MNRSAAKKMKQRSAGKPDIELGKRIRLRRGEQKISQAEPGDKLGVSLPQVQKYAKGVNRRGVEDGEGVVPRVARVYDQRQVVRIRQLDLRGERVALRVPRRMLVVVVEP